MAKKNQFREVYLSKAGTNRYTAVFSKWHTGAYHVCGIIEADLPFISSRDYKFLLNRLFEYAAESYEYDDLRVDVYRGYNMGDESDPVLSIISYTRHPAHQHSRLDAYMFIGNKCIRRANIAE